MPRPDGRYTLPGTTLPEGDVPPTLLFHKWQQYDAFRGDSFIDDRSNRQTLNPFGRDETGRDFLASVAERVQKAGEAGYRTWHRRFSDACDALEAEDPVPAPTLWRMVVGWATNPALEVGLTLDHLYGFPYVPGSAVKGLLHRMAELELCDRVPALPAEDQAPPSELRTAVGEALHVRALFGSVHVRSGQGEPPSALVALEGWRHRARRLARTPGGEAWKDLLPGLEAVCSDTAAGGMVTCFDAVPTPDSFEQDRKLLTVDVLTPHDPKPNPILFLAVRDGALFELRYRLAPWPSDEPRDPGETARAEALAGIDRETALERIRGWLVQGLTEHGLGGKTSAGYGYFRPEDHRLQAPAALEEPEPPVVEEGDDDDDLPEGELEALRHLPEGIDENRATAALDKMLVNPASPARTAVVRRFVALFPERVEDWATSQARAKVKRTRQIREVLEDQEDSP